MERRLSAILAADVVGYSRLEGYFLKVDLVLPRDLEVELLTSPPSSFAAMERSSPPPGHHRYKVADPEHDMVDSFDMEGHGD